MSVNISSSVLFHFTRSMADLKSILKNGFFPHYCPEYGLGVFDREAAPKRSPPRRAAPVVCFCDLPLSLISKHLEEYGDFGIGLRKKWGLENGVSPVIYTHSEAQTRRSKLSLTDIAASNNDREAANALNLWAAYTKPVSGPAWRDNKVKRDVMFYDEREWRYVPFGVEPLFMEWNDYANTAKKNAHQRRLKKQYTLRIFPDDIQYLIVPNDDHVLELSKYLRVSRLYSHKDVILVTTAIMTKDCIVEDM